jgi:hypothetical protein
MLLSYGTCHRRILGRKEDFFVIFGHHAVPTTYVFRTEKKLTKTISWSRVLSEKLTGPQLVKKFTAFYGT